MKDTHICVERAMHHNCPVCFEYLFDTTKDMTVLSCGHTIHLQCVKEMEQRFQYSCPVCSKSYCDMSRVWLKLDQEVASMPMPETYENKMVWILCNDCGETSEVNFHIVAHKCTKCTSYNTRRTRGGPTSCSSRVEMVRWVLFWGEGRHYVPWLFTDSIRSFICWRLLGDLEHKAWFGLLGDLVLICISWYS